MYKYVSEHGRVTQPRRRASKCAARGRVEDRRRFASMRVDERQGLLTFLTKALLSGHSLVAATRLPARRSCIARRRAFELSRPARTAPCCEPTAIVIVSLSPSRRGRRIASRKPPSSRALMSVPCAQARTAHVVRVAIPIHVPAAALAIRAPRRRALNDAGGAHAPNRSAGVTVSFFGSRRNARQADAMSGPRSREARRRVLRAVSRICSRHPFFGIVRALRSPIAFTRASSAAARCDRR